MVYLELNNCDNCSKVFGDFNFVIIFLLINSKHISLIVPWSKSSKLTFNNFLSKIPLIKTLSLLNNIFLDINLSKATKYTSSKNSFCTEFNG